MSLETKPTICNTCLRYKCVCLGTATDKTDHPLCGITDKPPEDTFKKLHDVEMELDKIKSEISNMITNWSCDIQTGGDFNENYKLMYKSNEKLLMEIYKLVCVPKNKMKVNTSA